MKKSIRAQIICSFVGNKKGEIMGEQTELPGISRLEEEQKFEDIIKIATRNLREAEKTVAFLGNDLHDMLVNFDSQKDKETMVFWNNTQVSYNEAREELLRCQRARRKPYFGRIDFIDTKSNTEEVFYIGRVGIKDTLTKRAVIDWRAPVATVYYENALGPCSYTVMNIGTYDIELTRKRTYEIKEDKLIDFFDSEVVSNDDLLTKYLAKNKKAVLGDIIATIQKEQNLIIRKSPRNNILVQGVAGSGKTTVAMHRISYILYNYEGEFRPKDFYIIGSNQILLNYITSVLPDLDVYGVSQMTMEQLFIRLLYEDWNDKEYSIQNLKKGDEIGSIKGSYQWFHDLEEFCSKYEWLQIPHEEVITYNTKRLLIKKDEIETYIRENVRVSMQNKILSLNERVMARLENEIRGKDISYLPEDKKDMRRFYQFYFGKKLWKGSIFELYDDFLKGQIAKGLDVGLPGTEFDVYDLAALAYLYKRIKETDTIREASHVVIDEAQDFGMMAYASLEYCLRRCTYTIMGDVSQNIHFGYGLNDWEELKKLILKDKFDTFAILKKSYRNTIEISNFATDILRHGTFAVYPVEPILRHGDVVRITKCEDEKEMFSKTVEIVENWKLKDYETMAVVCRDETEARYVSDALKGKLQFNDSCLETTEFRNGVMVLPVVYTKGLEFDAVLLFNPTNETYPADDGHTKLLYVAATRALHELAVVHDGDLTDLIGKEVPIDKKMKSFNLKQEDLQAEVDLERRKQLIKEAKSHPKMLRRGTTEQDALLGVSRRTGPKRVVVPGQPKSGLYQLPVPKGAKKQGMLGTSKYQFGDVPDTDRLRIAGHGRIDTAVRFLKRNKDYVEITSNYGILRLEPITERIIRISFRKGQIGEFALSDEYLNQQTKPKWACKETKHAIGIATEQLLIQIEKRTGTLKFFTRGKKLLLSEREKDSRQVDEEQNIVWNFFQWEKNETIWARGLSMEELLPMHMKARYISYGKKKMRMPLLVSDKGYGIGIASKGPVMCCNIPMHGTYMAVEDTKQIDYYFMYGGSAAASLELHKIVCKQL